VGGSAAPVRVAIERLEEFVNDVLHAAGLDRSGAARTARLMVAADARGSDSHGVFRLPQYVRRILAGGINKHPDIRVIEDRLATALLDGDNGMGHLVMSRAAELAIEKARRTGVGWVGARRSNHAGPAALYASMPLAHDMIGVYLAIGSANHMAPWGGTEMLLSTNPISIAVPAGRHAPVVLDMATTAAAYGKVKKKVQAGDAIPEGWMIDRSGRPLTDPARVHEGSLLPIGGFKGYGLALMFGLLAGTLNGAAFGRDVVDFNADFTSVTNTGHCILAIDIASFMDVSTYKARVDAVCGAIESSASVKGGEAIRVPGARSAALLAESVRSGIRLDSALLDELDRLAVTLGLAPLPGRARDG
jgi:LDH2 family malate/lactate/ureidoglycolate dehydrogenase